MRGLARGTRCNGQWRSEVPKLSPGLVLQTIKLSSDVMTDPPGIVRTEWGTLRITADDSRLLGGLLPLRALRADQKCTSYCTSLHTRRAAHPAVSSSFHLSIIISCFFIKTHSFAK